MIMKIFKAFLLSSFFVISVFVKAQETLPIYSDYLSDWSKNDQSNYSIDALRLCAVSP